MQNNNVQDLLKKDTYLTFHTSYAELLSTVTQEYEMCNPATFPNDMGNGKLPNGQFPIPRTPPTIPDYGGK